MFKAIFISNNISRSRGAIASTIVCPQRATRAAAAAPGSWRGGTSPSWTSTPCGGSTASTGHTALLSPCPGLTHPSLHRVDFEMFGYSPNSYLELARNSLWYTNICHKIVKISCYSKVEYSSQSKLLLYLMLNESSNVKYYCLKNEIYKYCKKI